MATTVFEYTGGVQMWTVPEGVYSVQAEAVGGGGSSAGAGGGGAAYARVNSRAVTPGQVLRVVVGIGGQSTNGTASSSAINTVNGAPSYIGASTDEAWILASGGGAAGSIETFDQVAQSVGVGGTTGIGDVIFAGGNGGQRVTPTGQNRCGGGGGGSGYSTAQGTNGGNGNASNNSASGLPGTSGLGGGAGGTGIITNSTGGIIRDHTRGVTPGGGAGGFFRNNTSGRVHLPGGDGRITLTYTVIVLPKLGLLLSF
jgi:hypothetical protein